MESTALATLVSVLLSVVVQIGKGRFTLDKNLLRVLSILLGAVGAGLSSYATGATGIAEMATNTGIGAALPAGVHAGFLKDTPWGQLLQNVGIVVLGLLRAKGPSSPG